MLAPPENDEGRPTANRAASEIVTNDTCSVPRCLDCGRLIRAAKSLRTGLGGKCRSRRRAGVAA